MILRRKDNGKHVELSVRSSLEVRLPESQVSGYMWLFDENSCPCLRLVDSIYVERGAARFNGLGERSWFFATGEPGTCELVFNLVRPWSRPSPEFCVRVEIK